MIETYQFLLSLKLLEFEINELTDYSKECSACFELLRTKLDELSRFITSEENEQKWRQWGSRSDIQESSDKLRETSVRALCDIEKYQSICTYNHEIDISQYLSLLSQSVKNELELFGIHEQSKVLFIGAGAFPITALTIAKETGAAVMGLDIDLEAVELARNVAKVSGLDAIVSFSHQSVKELPFTKSATHIIIASLVKNKLEVLEDVKGIMNPEARVILRYGNGLKSMFNYPLETDLSAEWVQIKNSQSNAIYDTIILEKSPALVSMQGKE